MTKLTEIIKNLSTGVDINKINLSQCMIGNEGVKSLLQALENNNTVTDINLGGNAITSGGARLIAYFLEKNRSVTHIDLRWNEIGNEGAKRILEVQAIRKNSTVTEINLKWNKTVYTNDYTLLSNINTTLEKNIQAKKTLSKKSNQGIDSAQKKLPATNIGLKEKQEVSKGMQQLQEVVQEQKSEQQEEVNAALAQIINKQIIQDDILKAMTEKLQLVVQRLEEMGQQLDVVIGEIKLPKEQTQQTENISGTETESPELLGAVSLDQPEQY